jgi:hypothetical protein
MTRMQQAVAGISGCKAFRDRIGASRRAPLCERRGLATPPYALKTLGLITMVGIAANFTTPIHTAQASGDFRRTCRNIYLDANDFSKTATLTADCLKQDGRTYNSSWINLNPYITNHLGGLYWRDRPGGGDFQESCYAAYFPYNLHTTITSDQCLDGAGHLNHFPGLIFLDDHITNNKGNLQYVGP